MELLDSTLAALLLLGPGFVTLTIHDHIVGKSTRGGQFEKTMLSLILSAFLALPFIALNHIRTAEHIARHLFAHPLLSLFDAVLLTLSAAFLFAATTSVDTLRLAFHRMLRPTAKALHDERFLWDRTLEKHFLKAATVTLTDGSRFYGFIDGHSTADEPSTLRLGKARDITHDDVLQPLPSSDFLIRGEFVKSIEVEDDAEVAVLHEARGWHWLAGLALLAAILGRATYAVLLG